MARPRRLYTDDKGRFYYIIKKKKVFVKVPKGVSQKQVQKVNVKTIINLPEKKKIKRRKKKIAAKFERPPTQNLATVLARQTDGGLPYYIFREKKEFPTLEEISKGKKTEPLKLEYVKAPELRLPEPERPKMLKGEVLSDKKIKEFTTFKGEELDRDRPAFMERSFPSAKPVLPPIKPKSGISFESPVVSPIKIQPLTEDVKIRSARKLYKDVLEGMTDREIIDKYKGTKYAITTENLNDAFDKFAKELDKEERRREREKRKIEGKGDDGDDGLYNDQIEKIMKKRVKDYVPVIPIDKTDELLKYVGKADKRFGAIINTADSTSDGTGTRGNSLGHWYSIFINNEDDYPSIEVFDPLVSEKIDDRLYNTLRKIAKKMNPEMYFKFKQNMLRRQKLTKSTCGFHAMKFVEDRMNGIPFSEASGYDGFIEKQKGADDSTDGEKQIEKYKNKFDSYI